MLIYNIYNKQITLYLISTIPFVTSNILNTQKLLTSSKQTKIYNEPPVTRWMPGCHGVKQPKKHISVQLFLTLKLVRITTYFYSSMLSHSIHSYCNTVTIIQLNAGGTYIFSYH